MLPRAAKYRVALQHDMRELRDLDRATDQLYLTVMQSLGTLCEARSIGDKIDDTEHALEWADLVAQTAANLAETARSLYDLSLTTLNIVGKKWP